MRLASGLWRDDAAQDLVEYALITVLFSLVSTLLLGGFGTTIKSVWSAFNSTLTTAIN